MFLHHLLNSQKEPLLLKEEGDLISAFNRIIKVATSIQTQFWVAGWAGNHYITPPLPLKQIHKFQAAYFCFWVFSTIKIKIISTRTRKYKYKQVQV